MVIFTFSGRDVCRYWRGRHTGKHTPAEKESDGNDDDKAQPHTHTIYPDFVRFNKFPWFFSLLCYFLFHGFFIYLSNFYFWKRTLRTGNIELLAFLFRIFSTVDDLRSFRLVFFGLREWMRKKNEHRKQAFFPSRIFAFNTIFFLFQNNWYL